MLKKIFLILAAAGLSLPSAQAQIAFDRGAADIGGMTSSQDVPAVPAPVQDKGWFNWGSHDNDAPAQMKEWTVMVYVNGKNDLEVAGLYNINKMELAGSNDFLNIVTEIGRMKGQQNKK